MELGSCHDFGTYNFEVSPSVLLGGEGNLCTPELHN